MKNTNPAAPTTFYKIDNPEEFARNMLRLFEGSCHVKQFYCRNAVTRLCSTFVFSMP